MFLFLTIFLCKENRMKLVRLFSLAILMLLLSVGKNYAQNPSKKINIAVIDLASRGGLSPSEVGSLTDRLRSMLVRTNAFNVVDRGAMEDILKEQGFQMSGCTSTDCAVEAGKILGVEQMVSGTIGRIGKLYTIDVVLIDVSTSQILKSLTRDYKGEVEGLVGLMRSIADELAGKRKPVAPVAVTTGALKVTSTPAQAAIYIDNNFEGNTPARVDKLSPGNHVLEIKKDGYAPIKGKFAIEANKTKEYSARLKKLFTISINSRPPEALVYINGNKEGQTPYKHQAVEGNKLDIVLQKKNYKPFRKNLLVKKDEQVQAELEKIAAVALQTPQSGKSVKESGGHTWFWIGGGVAVAAAAAYFLLPKNESASSGSTSQSFPVPPSRP